MTTGILDTLFRGSRVALVGPSKSVIGAGFGAEIEEYDIVVRLNHQWPVPETLRPDIGQRMDVLYHCCNPDISVARFARIDFADTRIVFHEAGFQAAMLRTICRELGVPVVEITSLYRRLHGELGTFPNTGLVAITHLLKQPLACLKLFGITFFRDGYYLGYPGHGADPRYWEGDSTPKQIWNHRLDLQFEHFARMLESDPRLSVDARSLRLLEK